MLHGHPPTKLKIELKTLLTFNQVYLPEDLKGKGEPSYSIEKALKQNKLRRRTISDNHSGIEMTSPRPRPASSGTNISPAAVGERYSDWQEALRSSASGDASSSAAAAGGGGLLRKRFGSLRKR